MASRFHIVLFLTAFFFGNKMLSQNRGPKFSDFKENFFLQKFQPLFRPGFATTISKKDISFRLNNFTGKKPVFCRMEDNISDRYNFIFQLRAGSDEHYRSLAFPKRIEKRSKYFE